MRGDLADVRLADRVFAPHYAAAILCSAVTASPILAERRTDSEIRSEILPGEGFEMLELATDYAWGICLGDGSAGFVAREALSYDDPEPPAPLIEFDPAGLAERLIGAPAKPGGRSPAGFNCTGLIFYVMRAAGHAAPRFGDLQAATLGAPVPTEKTLVRGDLVFFADHAAIMSDTDTAVHVTDAVVREPLDAIVAQYGPIIARRRP